MLERLQDWAGDENYHVRRLVSEGTRPRLPWAKAVTLRPDQTLPLLDRLHGDPTRYVTRSVANHLNDLTKATPDLVLDRLRNWQVSGRQDARELRWITSHALRSAIKAGHPGAMAMLGYDPAARVDLVALEVPATVRIGEVMDIAVTLSAPEPIGVLVDYLFWRRRADGTMTSKVFKLKQARLKPGEPLHLSKAHRLKGDATTYRLYPGAHRIAIQVNGRVLGEATFELLP